MTFLRWTAVALAAALAGCSDDPSPTPQDAGADVATDLGVVVDGGDDAGADAGDAGADDVPAAAASFTQVQAIFTRTCITPACHGSSGSGGMRLRDAAESHAALVGRPSDQVPSVQLVAPGDPDNSYLVMKVEGTMRRLLPTECMVSPGRNPCGAQMPQLAAPLTQEERTLIRAWIAAGAMMD